MTMLQHGIIESGGYNIDRSLRFRSSASAYLSRTPASAGNRKTWTWSGWVKLGALGGTNVVFQCTPNSSNQIHTFGINANNQLSIYFENTSGVLYKSYITSTAVYRDPSAWYHLVFIWDTTQATVANRVKAYINGQQVTLNIDNLGSGQFPQNYDGFVNSTSAHNIGRHPSNLYMDGYLAEVNFIDGQALTPSSFGQTDAVTGVWVPKKYTGTYGTNGFYLDFKDNTSATTLAYDKSGNGNNWTANNISTTAGSTYDSMTDVPTLTSATAANYCVLNPLDKAGAASITNANLSLTSSSVAWGAVRASFAITSGKWYWEVNMVSVDPTNNGVCIGIANEAVLQTGYNMTGQWVYNNNSGGRKGLNGTSSAYGSAATTGDIVGVALDMDAGTLTFYRNNVSMGVAASSGLPTTAFPIHQTYYNDGIAINFGQRPFSYTPPTGFKALNTFNLPDPTIKKPNQYMDATTYTGNGVDDRNITGTNFAPDFVWIKQRSGVNQHELYDTVRGATKRLMSNDTAAEDTAVNNLQAFLSNGFQVGTAGSVNANGATYVGWQWKKGATPGFDIVTYTGTGVARTVSHSLGVAPAMMIVKDRSSSSWNWVVYHKTLGATKILELNTTNANTTYAAAWNNAEPTSSVFTVGTAQGTNNNTENYVAYLFAEIAGFSKFGSYTGNGSTDGPFVYCGFRPKYVMIKKTDSATANGNWVVIDSSRNTYNLVNSMLFPNLSDAENTVTAVDFVSNGFKVRADGTVTGMNLSGSNFIFCAFAENPFKYSLAR